jgi:NAD(P)-dependent dehydrogenase (short-subunit alcohol dehydrogenase family)
MKGITLMARLKDKKALITGGNSGIGLATAKAFIDEGAHVIITGRNPDSLHEAETTLGSRAAAFEGDVSVPADIERLGSFVASKFGELDIIFANAGVAGASPLGGTTVDIYRQIFDTNVAGVFFCVQKIAPLMRSGGSIILNASIAPKTARPATTLYAASKAAVRSMAQCLSSELCLRGIRVNAVSPGPIQTPIWSRTAAPQAFMEAIQRQVTRAIPVGRLGRAEEVAQVVVFLASDESSFMLGSEIVVDGGVSQVVGAAPAFREGGDA